MRNPKFVIFELCGEKKYGEWVLPKTPKDPEILLEVLSKNLAKNEKFFANWLFFQKKFLPRPEKSLNCKNLFGSRKKGENFRIFCKDYAGNFAPSNLNI